ncbi:hypothetical protein SDC9_195962 [bioreactor metagenome]|uniref:Uncharacterized protein n=1 Tax=bioreactor metagenome TaxID=1076179 RepID=A0A645IAR9_9ZZZZ
MLVRKDFALHEIPVDLPLHIQQVLLVFIAPQDQKLVSHRAGEKFILLQGICQGPGIFFQNPVPILIAEYIIDIFEVLKIDIYYR